MTSLRYSLSGDHPPTLGLIVLQVDETIEDEFRRLIAPATRLHVTRVASGDALTPDTIAAMENRLPAAAALLPPAARFDAVGYACTSGAALIGPGRVRALVQTAAQTRAVTDPLTAALAALAARGVRRVGLLSPYVPAVAAPLVRAFGDAGLEVTATLSFGEEVEARVARIDAASVRAAARTLARQGRPDALFLSCTNLRTLDLIPELETALGLPVLSSNSALAWHMGQLAARP